MVMALVFVREKLDTADMSSFYLLDKEILVHPSWWTFTRIVEKRDSGRSLLFDGKLLNVNINACK